MLDDKSKREFENSLSHAGCSQEQIAMFFREYEAGNREQARHILELRRKEALKQCHELEHCISCLDYLVFAMENGRLQ